MMPKGVEHFATPLSLTLSDEVKIPMMPKGVEHCGVRALRGTLHFVKIPMMPKGVEHPCRQAFESSMRGEDSNDAERR